jgi:hypothetical protein
MDWGTHLASFKYTAGEQDSVVIISAGSPSTCVHNPSGVRILADGDKSALYSVKGITGFNSPLDTSSFTNHQGLVSAMRLEPGGYYAMIWPFAYTVVPKLVPRFHFTVAAGEVVYLGELFLDRGCDLQNFVTNNDEFERDIAILRVQNPTLAKANIQKRAMVPSYSASAPAK